MQKQTARIKRLHVFAILILALFVSFSYSASNNSSNVSTTASTTICPQGSACQLTSIPSQINKTSVTQAVNIVSEIINWVLNLLKTVKSYL